MKGLKAQIQQAAGLAPVAMIICIASASTQEPEDRLQSEFAARGMQQPGCVDTAQARMYVNSGHPWQPPFGLERVGAHPVVHVELLSDLPPCREYAVVAYRDGEETERHALKLVTDRYDAWPAQLRPKDIRALYDKVQLASIPDEVSLYSRRSDTDEFKELIRQNVNWPAVEVEAVARPDRLINPVDLGTILVPHNDLLLAGGQTAVIAAAAISHNHDLPHGQLHAWFDGAERVVVDMPLEADRRVTQELRVPLTVSTDRAVLHVSLRSESQEVWKKQINTIIISQPPRWPVFGAVETKLRYDAPISVQDPRTGKFSSLAYESAWDPKLKDVVVFLPNGSRFVFWRGSSYIPFWAGQHNTGLCYQWAENLTKQEGAVDAPEPLMDKELRYGRVRIVESTASRVHVRWTYQSADLIYQVFGDQAIEDYYFYPDGFGTRVLTLTSTAENFYQVSEFIVLTAQSAYPLEVLPSRMVEALFLDGQKEVVTFPVPLEAQKDVPPQRRFIHAGKVANTHQQPMVYRIFDHKDDTTASIYFNPGDLTTPFSFRPFYERGHLVTPAYWGSHWPLGRGKMTGVRIDERIHSSPTHSSLLTWRDWPKALWANEVHMPDTLGRSRSMAVRRWGWLIARTDASDETLLKWARSYSDPPSLNVKGARIDLPSYSPERRAIRLVVESPTVDIMIKPITHTVNPIFELEGAPTHLASVALNGEALPAAAYAWDGATLWLRASIGVRGAAINLQFGS